MASQFVKQLAEDNLSTYFLLPLIQLGKFSFGDANFLSSYVNQEGTVLTVEIVDFRLCDSFKTHPEYLKQFETVESCFICFSLPEKWQKDFRHFKAGTYSKFSEDALKMIIQWSGLAYQKEQEDGRVLTDSRIMAIEKNPILRAKWEEELGCIIPDDVELLSKPPEYVFREHDE